LNQSKRPNNVVNALVSKHDNFYVRVTLDTVTWLATLKWSANGS